MKNNEVVVTQNWTLYLFVERFGSKNPVTRQYRTTGFLLRIAIKDRMASEEAIYRMFTTVGKKRDAFLSVLVTNEGFMMN